MTEKTNLTPEELGSYLFGELPEDRAREIERLANADPELAARIDVMADSCGIDLDNLYGSEDVGREAVEQNQEGFFTPVPPGRLSWAWWVKRNVPKLFVLALLLFLAIPTVPLLLLFVVLKWASVNTRHLFLRALWFLCDRVRLPRLFAGESPAGPALQGTDSGAEKRTSAPSAERLSEVWRERAPPAPGNR